MSRSVRVGAALVATAVLAVGCSNDGNGDPPGRAAPLPPSSSPSATSPSAGPAGPSPSTSTATPTLRPGTPQAFVRGLAAPWGLAFLPGGDALVSERDSARLLRVRRDGSVQVLGTVPGVDASGEGGLLGLAVRASFDTDRLVYAYYTSARDNRIVRFRLDGDRPGPQQVLVSGIPVSGIHNGGRLVFGPDGMLYAGTGDASERGRSQDLGSLGGKVLRMTPEGKPPADNPVPGSLVFSRGHRNVQGLAFDPAGRLFASEFGQNRFDEVNRIVAGGNYGWPQVEGAGGSPAFRDPLVTWSTDEASPSGAAIAGGSLYVAALKGERLWRIPLDGRGGLGRPQPLFVGDFGRLRHVALAPDGSLWVLTSNRDGRGDPVADDDRIVRIPLIPA
jgi:glucose/arabinose dehydrogenase